MTVREMQVLFENLVGQYNKEMLDRLQTDQIELFLNHAQTKIVNREFIEKNLEQDRVNINSKLAKFRKLTRVIKGEVELNLIAIDGATGTFNIGETITGGTSGQNAKVVQDNGDSLYVSNLIEDFQNDETLTGEISAITANATSKVPINFTGIPNSKFFSLVNIPDYMYYIMSTSNVIRSDKSNTSFIINNTLTEIENLKDFINNAFNRPYIRSPFVSILENGFVIVHDNETIINSIDLYYLRFPKKMTSYTTSGVYANFVNTCELPEEMHEEIVEMAVKSAIAVKDPTKYQISLNENREHQL